VSTLVVVSRPYYVGFFQALIGIDAALVLIHTIGAYALVQGGSSTLNLTEPI